MDTKAIRLVLFDVDGVLTDGTLYIGPEGEVFKAFNAKDGVAISLLKKHGIEVGIISGKASKALDFRIKQLGIDHAITGCSDKLSALYSLMKKVALSIAPVDAHPLAINAAHYISVAKGGKGVARESAEYILKNAGLSLEDMYADMVGQYDISQ